MSNQTEYNDVRMADGIWPDEVKRAKEKCKVGDKVYILNKNVLIPGTVVYGRPERLEIVSKSRHLVVLKNNLSCTYPQLAKWYRNRRIPIE